jgi:hypothetical protein
MKYIHPVNSVVNLWEKEGRKERRKKNDKKKRRYINARDYKK